MPPKPTCRICAGTVQEFADFGTQPMANGFLLPGDEDAFTFRLAVAVCERCEMVQLVDEAPHERMFSNGYPYRTSESALMRAHFERTARGLLDAVRDRSDPHIVELGCNDGSMLRTVAEAGVRHVGVEPCGEVAEVSRVAGLRVRSEFFDDDLAADIRRTDGRADVIFSANTISHISFIDSILRGVDLLLAPDGIFVFEDPYFGDIIERTAFDQIYDEHVFFFTARSVRNMVTRNGLELVDVERLPVHGGEVRYTVAHPGVHPVSPAVTALLAEEEARGLTTPATLHTFAAGVERVRDDLVTLLNNLRDQGKRVVGYGATGKSTTLLNYCGIGPELVPFVCDSTAAKQGRLSPGSHIPVRNPVAFAEPYPDYALLFAWNHADEIMGKEHAFRASGGRWILYVPQVHLT